MKKSDLDTKTTSWTTPTNKQRQAGLLPSFHIHDWWLQYVCISCDTASLKPFAQKNPDQMLWSADISKEEIGSQVLIKASIWLAWIWFCVFSLFKTFTFHTAEKSIWSPTLENNDFSLAKNFHSQVCRNADEVVHKVYWQQLLQQIDDHKVKTHEWARIEGAKTNYCFFELNFEWPCSLANWGKTAKSWIIWRT